MLDSAGVWNEGQTHKVSTIPKFNNIKTSESNTNVLFRQFCDIRHVLSHDLHMRQLVCLAYKAHEVSEDAPEELQA